MTGTPDCQGLEAFGSLASLALTPVSRWPTTLPAETIRAVLGAPLPQARGAATLAAPRISIVVLTHDSLAFNRLCLESVLRHSDPTTYELIVVDNASGDGTPLYLRALAERFHNIRVLLNEENVGFAAGMNQALRIARGSVLVLLNNDTIVTPGWLESLTSYLDDPAVGLVGPVTNRSGNEAEIAVSYQTYGELIDFASRYCRGHHGRSFNIRTVVMFCVALRRETYEGVGALDERFTLGLFEDDDYAMRVRRAGLRVICGEGAYVHHFGQGSLGRLAADGAYGRLFHENRRRWEEKWGVSWQPYEGRVRPEYECLKERIRDVVERVVPPTGNVLVVSKGDDDLLDLNGRTAAHFPQADHGGYSGHNPKDADAAIAHLQHLHDRGADFLVIPKTALWWLEYYDGLKNHLEKQHRCVASEDDVCLIVQLGRTAADTEAGVRLGTI